MSSKAEKFSGHFLKTERENIWTRYDPLGNKKEKKKTDAFLTFNFAFYILSFLTVVTPRQKNGILFYILLMKHTKTVQSRCGCVWTVVRAPPLLWPSSIGRTWSAGAVRAGACPFKKLRELSTRTITKTGPPAM